MDDIKQTAITSKRDYAIRKGKVLERFTEVFCNRFEYDALTLNIYELLIRDADPYTLIEKLVELNADLFKKLHEAHTLISPNK